MLPVEQAIEERFVPLAVEELGVDSFAEARADGSALGLAAHLSTRR